MAEVKRSTAAKTVKKKKAKTPSKEKSVELKESKARAEIAEDAPEENASTSPANGTRSDYLSQEEIELARANAPETPTVKTEVFIPSDASIAPAPDLTIPKIRLVDEYTLHSFYDKTANQYVGMVLELPEMKATGTTRAAVIRDIENRVDSHLNLLKRQGDAVPESFQSRKYPENLNVPISQGLFRRLDVLSRQEKISLDQLVVELLSGMIEKRLQGPSNRPQHSQHRHQQHSHRHEGRDNREGHRDQGRRDHREHRPEHRSEHRAEHRSENRDQREHRTDHREHRDHRGGENRRDNHRENHRENPRENAPAPRENMSQPTDNDNIGNRINAPQGGSQNNRSLRPRGRNYHETMDSRENFLEYVRNLEKSKFNKR